MSTVPNDSASPFDYGHAIRDSRKLSEHAKVVALMIWLRGGSYQGAHPSIATLADDTGTSKSTVKRAITELLTGGWIKIRHQHSRDGGWDHNQYELAIPDHPAARPAG